MNETEDQFSMHAEPVWRDRANFIINAALPEADRYEQLWCRQVEENAFEICCIPFFLYGVALGDTVQTSESSGRQHVMNGVLKRSGRFVFRVHFGQSQLQNQRAAIQGLNGMGALLEWSSPTLLAIDARDDDHATEILGFLEEQENRGSFMFETGA